MVRGSPRKVNRGPALKGTQGSLNPKPLYRKALKGFMTIRAHARARAYAQKVRKTLECLAVSRSWVE